MAHMQPSRKQTGSTFEAYIESLYQSLGFKTKRDENIYGQQIDIVADKQIDGVGHIKILIECKYLSTGSVSNQVIFDFISYLNSLPAHLDVTKGVIVTNTSFSAQASQATNKMLSLVTQNELEKEILNLNSPFVTLKRNYEADSIYTHYIPLDGIVTSFDSGIPQSEKVINIEQRLFDQVKYYNHTHWSYISVLGDYGSGKTTLLRRLFYLFIKEGLKQQSNLKPVYLELKNYYKFQDMHLFIASTFTHLFGKDISRDLLKKEMDSGRLLFLFDGFDEMSPQVSEEIRLKNFNELIPFLTSRSPCLLSCRPSYFVSTAEYRSYINAASLQKRTAAGGVGSEDNTDTYAKLFNHYFPDNSHSKVIKDGITYSVARMTSDQINNYLEKSNDQFKHKCASDWTEVKEFLSGIYDLDDLMTKPILLSMIKDTILLLGSAYKEKDSDFGPSSIYEIYTSINLDFDWQKGETRHLLTKEERRQFAEAIAMSMFDKNILDVSYADLKSISSEEFSLLKSLFKRIPAISQDHVVADIQICSFITKSFEDRFKFVHKSYMEFFVARSLKNKILQHGDISLEKRFSTINFPKEILHFIGSFALVDEELKNILFQPIKRPAKNILCRNILAARLYSSFHHEDLIFYDVKFNEINVIKIEIHHSKMAKVDFVKSEWRKTTLTRMQLSEMVISNSKLTDVTINDSTGDLKIMSSEIDGGHFYNSNLVLTCAKSNFRSTTFINVEMNVETCTFSKCTFENVQMIYSLRLYKSFSGCTGYIFTYALDNVDFDLRGLLIAGNLLIVNLSRFNTVYSNHTNWVRKIIAKDYTNPNKKKQVYKLKK